MLTRLSLSLSPSLPFPPSLSLSFSHSFVQGNHELVQSVEKHRGKGPRYDFYEEFTRCGALSGDGLGDTELWRASQLNNTYEFAPTYPALNIMPAQFSDAELRSLGGFRSKCRVPSMSWFVRVGGATANTPPSSPISSDSSSYASCHSDGCSSDSSF